MDSKIFKDDKMYMEAVQPSNLDIHEIKVVSPDPISRQLESFHRLSISNKLERAMSSRISDSTACIDCKRGNPTINGMSSQPSGSIWISIKVRKDEYIVMMAETNLFS